jgi:hypothetical protein
MELSTVLALCMLKGVTGENVIAQNAKHQMPALKNAAPWKKPECFQKRMPTLTTRPSIARSYTLINDGFYRNVLYSDLKKFKNARSTGCSLAINDILKVVGRNSATSSISFFFFLKCGKF